MPKKVLLAFLVITIGIIIIALNFSPIPIPVPGISSNNSSKNSNITTAYPTYYSGPRPETVIVNGPKDGEIISNTPVVTFQFVAIWNGDFRNIIFETKIDEIDKDWQISSSNSRTIQLLPGEHIYHFSVRAKTKDGIEDYTPASRKFIGKISSEVGQIKITSILNSYPQKLVLYNYGNDVNISNWTIESSLKKITISDGVKLFRPDNKMIFEDIVLENGDYLYLIGKKSPLNFNFYLNRCFGYLTNAYDFNFIFLKDCPRPNQTEISYFSNECQFFINNLNACQIPSSNDINRFNNDPACQQFLNDYYGYNACVNRYQYSDNFFKKEWYVFANEQFADFNHDKIILKDATGAIVDVYQY